MQVYAAVSTSTSSWSAVYDSVARGVAQPGRHVLVAANLGLGFSLAGLQ